MKAYLLVTSLYLVSACASVENCDPSKPNIFLIAACQDIYEIRHNELRGKIAQEEQKIALNKDKNEVLLTEVEQLNQNISDTKALIAQLDIKRDALFKKLLAAEQSYSDVELEAIAKELQTLLTQAQNTLERTYQGIKEAEREAGPNISKEHEVQFHDIKRKILAHVSDIKKEIHKIDSHHALATIRYSLSLAKLKIKDKRIQTIISLAEYTWDFIDELTNDPDQKTRKK